MSSVRFILRDIRVIRFWSAWTRSVNVGHVVRRCRRDKSVREVINCFRQAFLRPRRTLLLAATAAYKANDDGASGNPPSCSRGITDRDLEALLSDLGGVDELLHKTLYCITCNCRLVIDKKQSGVAYCTCKNGHPAPQCLDGWVPYMEAEDVVIWRKEHKPGQGLYAYKVYGCYKDVKAQDFADVNVDGAYRRVWDTAVAALSIVERSANGVLDQAVLHWEVLWPRLFANRDYVYIRRHKEYSMKSEKCRQLLENEPAPRHMPGTGQMPDSGQTHVISQTPVPQNPAVIEERPSVHSNAKRKSIEASRMETKQCDKTNKVYVIVSRSCTHPDVPESRNAIRVSEYWSHMIVRTIDGADKPGMEFCLTYYDEPAVGGMPTGVATWATGRAAPQYLQRMRLAAKDYDAYKKLQNQDVADFPPFCPETKQIYDEEEKTETRVKEEDMESSKTGPDMENGQTREQGTQTEETHPPLEVKVNDKRKVTEDKAVNTQLTVHAQNVNEKSPIKSEGDKNDMETSTEEDVNNTASWWRYVYPSYYFM